jgi:hypothetical protein
VKPQPYFLKTVHNELGKILVTRKIVYALDLRDMGRLHIVVVVPRVAAAVAVFPAAADENDRDDGKREHANANSHNRRYTKACDESANDSYVLRVPGNQVN